MAEVLPGEGRPPGEEVGQQPLMGGQHHAAVAGRVEHRPSAVDSVVAVDVASESNQLPVELRSQLFYLFEFTQHYTRKLLADEDRSLDAEPLIEINQNIIRGLQGSEEAPAS